MKKIFLLLTILILTLQATAVHANSKPDFNAIDSFIKTEMEATHLPGLALAIMHNDEIVYLKGYGTADDSGSPVTPQTPFMLASVSKPFVSLAVMQLVEAGKVDLDAPVQTYLPWFRVADPAASAQITVRMLLNHTSGIPASAGMEFFASNADMETQVRSLAGVELDRPVGESYEYTNLTYSTLALVVQEVSGESFESYLQTHIFDPLEMTHSFTSKEKASQNGLAVGHTFAFGLPLKINLPENHGGVPYCCMIASAEDMSHFLIAQLNGGRYKNASLLSPAGMDAMHAPAVKEDRPDRYYGMAWETRSINGIPAVMHTGEGLGWQANIIMLEEGWGVVVLANGYDFVDDNFGADRLRGIARGVVSLLNGQEPPAAESRSGVYVFYSVLLVIVFVQTFGIVRSVNIFRKKQGLKKLTGIYLPLILNLTWAGIVFFVIPNILMPFALMKHLVPVLAYVLLTSGSVALVWAFARTLFAFRQAK